MPELNPDGTVYEMPTFPSNAEHRAQAVANCGMCDEWGYRGPMVCDHVDHVATTEHGRALVRAELERIRQRKADQ